MEKYVIVTSERLRHRKIKKHTSSNDLHLQDSKDKEKF